MQIRMSLVEYTEKNSQIVARHVSGTKNPSDWFIGSDQSENEQGFSATETNHTYLGTLHRERLVIKMHVSFERQAFSCQLKSNFLWA